MFRSLRSQLLCICSGADSFLYNIKFVLCTSLLAQLQISSLRLWQTFHNLNLNVRFTLYITNRNDDWPSRCNVLFAYVCNIFFFSSNYFFFFMSNKNILMLQNNNKLTTTYSRWNYFKLCTRYLYIWGNMM